MLRGRGGNSAKHEKHREASCAREESGEGTRSVRQNSLMGVPPQPQSFSKLGPFPGAQMLHSAQGWPISLLWASRHHAFGCLLVADSCGRQSLAAAALLVSCCTAPVHDSGTVLWCGAELSRGEREEDFDLCSFSRTINSGGVVNTARGYGEPVANRNQGCGGDASCSWRVSAETAAQPESSLSAD